ncbi:putative het domain containing protein [Phaeoacremonium minimum UCRPA7]|uniref:Putative het domain containing protein n=1 Tax=Phaeoacremonium minimum (strain UCR-PA7) TaxID=1286976 RepID=R8BLZ0_PHAM7|nr:putative het domain containing protein [Phaeoacremonium minimum UCRPA7]EOO00383.1 putative het domain containing protein [Phaeoacremonium minimum UCRPA7]
MASTIYRALDSAQHEIRLLKLLPAADFQDEIRCKLVYITLDNVEPYEALSYTWGKVEFSHPIVLDGESFKITANLDSALRYLRWPSEERTLWVDAVCINQMDIGERSHQVTLMKDIYQHCQTDLVWLGPNPSDLEVPPSVADPEEREKREEAAKKQQEKSIVDMAKGVALMKKIHDKDITTLNSMRAEWEERWTSKYYEKDGKNRWLVSWEDERALNSLFYWPRIWKRIWVMQELSCAPKILLVAGRETLDWNYVASFLGDTPYADAFHITFSHGSMSPMARHVFQHAQTIQHQRGIIQDVAASGYTSTLLDVLARFKFASSTDPRDKIYGLLGLVSEKFNIRVDYSKPVAHVFADVTKHIIDASENLDIICQNPWGDDDDNTKTEGLASWTADFTKSGFRGRSTDSWSGLLFAQRDVFSAGSCSLEVPCQVVNEIALRVHGVIIGHVGRVQEEEYYDTPEQAKQRPYKFGRRMRIPRNWMQASFGNDLLDDPALEYPATGEPALQAYWRTLVVDCTCYKIQRLTEDEIVSDGAVFDTILRREPVLDENNRDIELEKLFEGLASQDMWERNYQRWTFAVTDNGLYTMLRKGTQEGDVIAVLDGGKVPIVLRPTEGPTGVTYSVINTAYVHGYMDGQAADEVTKGHLQRQEFLLG